MFFFNDTATTEIYTLSLHDALPIFRCSAGPSSTGCSARMGTTPCGAATAPTSPRRPGPRCRMTSCTAWRSEEHTSELQLRQYLVCRLLLEKKHIHSYTASDTRLTCS